MKKPAQVYAEIRKANPGKPFGPHWDGVGYYCGDGVWGDPEYVGMPGEYEFAEDAQCRPRKKNDPVRPA